MKTTITISSTIGIVSVLMLFFWAIFLFSPSPVTLDPAPVNEQCGYMILHEVIKPGTSPPLPACYTIDEFGSIHIYNPGLPGPFIKVIIGVAPPPPGPVVQAGVDSNGPV